MAPHECWFIWPELSPSTTNQPSTPARESRQQDNLQGRSHSTPFPPPPREIDVAAAEFSRAGLSPATSGLRLGHLALIRRAELEALTRAQIHARQEPDRSKSTGSHRVALPYGVMPGNGNAPARRPQDPDTGSSVAHDEAKNGLRRRGTQQKGDAVLGGTRRARHLPRDHVPDGALALTLASFARREQSCLPTSRPRTG